jgi:hypothetical protein
MPLRISISPMSLSPVWEATAAWRRFVACVSAMPSHQARLLWQAALSEARSMTMPTPLRQGSADDKLPSFPFCWRAVHSVFMMMDLMHRNAPHSLNQYSA